MYIVIPLIMAEIVINLQKSLGGQASIAFNQAVLTGWKIFFEFKEIVIIGYFVLLSLAFANIRLKYKCFCKRRGTFKQTLLIFNWILTRLLIDASPTSTFCCNYFSHEYIESLLLYSEVFKFKSACIFICINYYGFLATIIKY